MTLSLLGWVYFFCFILGLCYTAASLCLGAMGGGHGHGGGHADAGHGGAGHAGDGHAGGGHGGHGHSHGHGGKDVAVQESSGHPDYPVLSPLNVAMALTTFGGSGTVLNVMGVPTYKSFPVSSLLGLATWGLVFGFFFKLFRATQSSSESVAGQLTGKDATVTVSIPDLGLGEVSYVARGALYNAPARAEDKRPMSAGARAVIVRIEDGVCVVKASIEEKLKQL